MNYELLRHEMNREILRRRPDLLLRVERRKVDLEKITSRLKSFDQAVEAGKKGTADVDPKKAKKLSRQARDLEQRGSSPMRR